MKVVIFPLLLLGPLFLCCGCRPAGILLPAYKIEQTDSAHKGYRRTTVTSGTNVYVSDYEEYGLMLENPVPTTTIGRAGIGTGGVCSIPGQPVTAYIAVDEGSEMEAYAVFRHSLHPAFDWRKATFRKMENAMPASPNDHKATTDPALMNDVLSTVKDGTPVKKPPFTPANFRKYSALLFYTNQLPGLKFCIHVYTDDDGRIYLGESLQSDQWIKASDATTKWLTTP